MNESCVNIKSKEFQDLLSKTHLAANVLENIVHKYINTEGQEKSYPSVNDIIKELEKYEQALLESNPTEYIKIARERNNGYSLDKTPDGKDSILWKTLLEENNGDVAKTAIAKAKVYSSSFIAWFGDWINNPKEASKVVDENGEPLVVYHGSGKIFSKFDFSFLEKNTTRDKEGNVLVERDNSKAFFFTNNRNAADSYRAVGANETLGKYHTFYTNVKAILDPKWSGMFTPVEDKEEQRDFINYEIGKRLNWNFDLVEKINNNELSENEKRTLIALVDRELAKIDHSLRPDSIHNIVRNTGTIDSKELNEYNTTGAIYGVFLNIRNPLVQNYDGRNFEHGATHKQAREAYSNGHDGFVFSGIRDPEIMDSYGIFDANQVKSALDNKGTFSRVTDNIYYNKDANSIYSILDALSKIKHLNKYSSRTEYLSKFKGKYFLPSGRENEFKQYISNYLVSIGLPINLIKYTTLKSGRQVALVNQSILKDTIDRNNTYIEISNTTKGFGKIEPVLTFLSNKTGLKYKIISEKDSLKFISKEELSRTNAFVVDDTCYFIEGRKLNIDIAAEEMLHPFVASIKELNNAAFRSLLDDAKKAYPKLYLEIAETYKDNIEEELVTQALSRAFRSDIENTPEGHDIKSLIQNFINYIIALFKSEFGEKESIETPFTRVQEILDQKSISAVDLESSISIKELARVVNSELQLKSRSLNRVAFNQDIGVTKGVLGVDKSQLIALLGSTMYQANVQEVAIKELVQNAFDSVKIASYEGEIEDPIIEVSIDGNDRSITVSDNGTGMTSEIVQKAFFTIGGSYKGDNVTNSLKSGGLGLAKMAFLFSSESIELTTVKDGIKTTVKTNPLEIQNDKFDIVTTKTSDPNGTTVRVVIPDNYIDSKGQSRSIYFSTHSTFLNKPLLGNVKIITKIKSPWVKESVESSDKRELPKNYVSIGTANSDFGDIEILVKPRTDKSSYMNVSVLSSGLYQFERTLRLDDESANFDVILNIKPSVDVKSALYPIANTREDFRETVRPEIDDLDFLLKRINHNLELEKVRNAFSRTVSMNVGEISSPTRESSTNNLLSERKLQIEKAVLEAKKDLAINEPQDSNNSISLKSVRVEREISEKKRRSSLNYSKVDTGGTKEIIVDTSHLDSSKPVFHNNTTMVIEEDGKKVLDELGKLLLELKDLYIQTYKDIYIKTRFDDKSSSDYIKTQYWGVSFDKGYGGVNVSPRLFSFLAINPFYVVKEYPGVDTALALTEYITHLIIHEFNHNYKSGEGANFTGRFPSTYAEFAGIGPLFTVQWKNKLYALINNNLETFKEYEQRYNQSVNTGDSLEGGNIRDLQSSKDISSKDDVRDSNVQRNQSYVSEINSVFRRTAEELANSILDIDSTSASYHNFSDERLPIDSSEKDFITETVIIPGIPSTEVETIRELWGDFIEATEGQEVETTIPYAEWIGLTASMGFNNLKEFRGFIDDIYGNYSDAVKEDGTNRLVTIPSWFIPFIKLVEELSPIQDNVIEATNSLYGFALDTLLDAVFNLQNSSFEDLVSLLGGGYRYIDSRQGKLFDSKGNPIDNESILDQSAQLEKEAQDINESSPLNNTQKPLVTDETGTPIDSDVLKEEAFVEAEIERQANLTNGINKLYSTPGVSVSLIRELADNFSYLISDRITQFIENPEALFEAFPDKKTNGWATEEDKQKDLDFIKNSSRKELIGFIGISTLVDSAASYFKRNYGNDDFEVTEAVIALLNDKECLNGLIFLMKPTFLLTEGIKFIDKNGVFLIEQVDKVTQEELNEDTELSDKEVEAEEGRDRQEAWQVETRTVNVFNSLSQEVRIQLLRLYNRDKNGDYIYSDFGVKERVNPKEAITKLLHWTQGSIGLEDMISKIEKHADKDTWVNDLLTILKDTSGKYSDFQNQFFTTLNKHALLYSITRTKDGKLISSLVNDAPASDIVMNTIIGHYNLGMLPLMTVGNVDSKRLNILKRGLDEVLNPLIKKGESRSEEDNDRIVRFIAYVYESFNELFNEDDIREIITNSNLTTISNSLSKIIETLSENRDDATYNPFDFKSGIKGYIKTLFSPITNILDNTITPSVYDNGKMYQTHVIPSWLSKQMLKFREQDQAKFEKFMQEEYGNSEWFRDTSVEDYRKSSWRNPWLRALYGMSAEERNKMFRHKVVLNVNNQRYMQDLGTNAYGVSILAEYFNGSNIAWFRIPIMSNKPSSEFISFKKFTGGDYQSSILNGFMMIFNQELSRISTVRERNKYIKEGDPEYITHFDKNGSKFNLLSFLNKYIDGTDTTSELSRLLNAKLNGEDVNEVDLHLSVQAEIMKFMNGKTSQIISDWKTNGMFEGCKKIESLKSLSNADLEKALEEFIWNDTFAAMNILELTITDPAFYKNTEDVQKRLAQIHSPGMRGNVDAVDYDGRKVTDGKIRTFYIRDFDGIKSNAITNIKVEFDRLIEEAKQRGEDITTLVALRDSVVDAYSNINVTDGQGYTTISSYRKKAIAFGKWSREKERVYEKILKGDFSAKDLDAIYQPLKPFIYSRVERNIQPIDRTTGDVVDTSIKNLPISIQNKNSEYLLLLADALLYKADNGIPNLIKVIHNIAENSCSIMGYNKGIDTIQFNSAVKTGEMGTLDLAAYALAHTEEEYNEWVKGMKGSSLNGLMNKEDYMNPHTEEECQEWVESNIYTRTVDENGTPILAYNTQAIVDEYPFEDYSIQQDIPEHFTDHEQSEGSQKRYITIADLPDGATFTYFNGEEEVTVDKKAFIEEYENTVAQNIEACLQLLISELKIDSSNRKARNAALSSILMKEISDDPRYGIDLLLSCSLDANGEFRIPLNDPTQCKRIEQLINSIIKNRVNKQMKDGGPIVQVSNFGSKQLSIRYYEKDGKTLLKKKDEWLEENPGGDYEAYCKENQGGIAYYEAYAPIFSTELLKFADANGNIDIKAIEAVEPELLDLICYRIPTEDKYSIIPVKIVGFLPRYAGEGIMLPYELTTQTGCDFDIDKMYCERLSFTIKDVGHKEAVKRVLETLPIERLPLTEADLKAAESKADAEINKRIEALNAKYDTRDDYEEFVAQQKENPEEWLNSRKKKSEARYNKELERIQNSREQLIEKYKKQIRNSKIPKVIDYINNTLTKVENRTLSKDWEFIINSYYKARFIVEEPTDLISRNNNKLFRMTRSVFNHRDIASVIQNPGNFDKQKSVGYACDAYRIPAISKEYSLAQLIAMNPKDVQKLISKHREPFNLAFIDSHLEYYGRNSAAGRTLGIFAIQKVAHAIIGNDTFETNLEFKFKSIGGVQLGTINSDNTITIKVDPTLDAFGEYVGKTFGSLVGASADAVKDPVLNFMNINGTTANILNGGLRIGVPFEIMGVLLASKAVSNCLKEVDKNKVTNNGKQNLMGVVNDRLKALEKKGIKDSKVARELSEGISWEELETAINSSDEVLEYKILTAVKFFSDAYNSISGITNETRLNSVGSATGPQVINNIAMKEKILNRDNYSQITSNGKPVTPYTMLKNHPILRAFWRGYEAAEVIMDWDMYYRIPVLTPELLSVLTREPRLASAYADFVKSYLAVTEGIDDLNNKAKNFDYYVHKFPREFFIKKEALIKEDASLANNKFLKAIAIDTTNYNSGIISILNIDTTGLNQSEKDELTSGWLDLYRKDKEFALDLFRYAFYRGGIGFSPKSFMGLIPLQMKEEIPGYTKLLSFNSLKAEIDAKDIMAKFAGNNANNKALVRTIPRDVHFSKLSDELYKCTGDSYDSMKNTLFCKSTDAEGNITGLYIKHSESKDDRYVLFEKIPVLGDGTFFEMGIQSNNNTLRDNGDPEIDEETPSTDMDDNQIRQHALFLISSGLFTREEMNKFKTLPAQQKEDVKDRTIEAVKNRADRLGLPFNAKLFKQILYKLC